MKQHHIHFIHKYFEKDVEKKIKFDRYISTLKVQSPDQLV